MFKINNYIIDELNQHDPSLLNCKLYHNGNMITGYEILELCIKATIICDDYCSYDLVLENNPDLINFEPKKDDINCDVINGANLCMMIFSDIVYLNLMKSKSNNLIIYGDKPSFSLTFSNNILENNLIGFVKLLYKLPPEIRDFAVNEYTNRLNNSEILNDIRISDYWGDSYGFSTLNNIILNEEWACGKLIKDQNGKDLWELFIIKENWCWLEKVADKLPLIDKLINITNNVDLKNYKTDLIKGLVE